MKKIILIFTVIILISGCLAVPEELTLEEQLNGVWYLHSYSRKNKNNEIVTLSCPFDAAEGIASHFLKKSSSDIDSDGIPDTCYYELYIYIEESNVISYYKVNFTGSNKKGSDIIDIKSGFCFDDSVDTYEISPDCYISSSITYIDGMKLYIKGNSLELSGNGVIKLIRSSSSEIEDAKPAFENQIMIYNYIMYVVMKYYFD